MSRFPLSSSKYRALGAAMLALAAGSTRAQWTATILHPAASTDSYAYEVNGGQQVGYAFVGGSVHASLWGGTPGSWIDLNPSGSTFSQANGVSNGTQAGFFTSSGKLHASLWTGTPESWVDLHPAGASESQAHAADSGRQAGFVHVGGASHATLWAGTPESRLDLHAFLPPGYDHSFALGLSTDLTNIYVSGYAVSTSGRDHAVLWTAPLAEVCPADFNADGFVTGDDFDQYGVAFELGDPAADFNADGFVTGDDFDAFVLAFEGGC